MYRITFLALLCCLVVMTCSNGLVKVEQQDEFGNTIKYTKSKETNALQGTWVRLNPEKKKLEEAQYEGGVLNGKRILYYDSGQPEIIENYVNGTFEGLFQIFHENGKLKQEGIYKNGETIGKWKGYYKSGQLKEVVTFSNNMENGPFTEYHENGNLKTEGYYLEGDNEDGLLKEYDETGTLIAKKECKKGICKTVWKKE